MGFATPAEENLRDTLSLDDWLIEKREASFMLEVHSESLHNLGIYKGDLVIVERIHTARLGQFVIVSEEGSWHIEPFSEALKNKQEIAAVLKAVIRKYA